MGYSDPTRLPHALSGAIQRRGIGNQDAGGSDESAQIYLVPDQNRTLTVEYDCIEDLDQLAGTGNIDDDPDFVDAPNGDYLLSADSPCIDRGDPDFEPLPDEKDINGDPRVIDDPNTYYPDAGPTDMGADEYN